MRANADTVPTLRWSIARGVAADCVTGIPGSVETDSPPLATVAALYVGPGVHDALQLVLLQLPDLLDGAGLLLTVLYSRNNNLSRAQQISGQRLA